MNEPTKDPKAIAESVPPTGNWRRNMWSVWLGELFAIAGFNAAMPFLPYFVQELGVTAPGQVEIWTGLLSSSGAWAMAVMSPIWGSLGDRFGRKLMLTRALFGGAVLIGAMALASNVQHLLVLRTMQGAVTGTVAAAYTLVAASTPPDKRTYALSIVQMGVYLGASLGPTLGGLAVDVWGYRASFALTGLLLACGGVMVSLLVREERADTGHKDPPSLASGLRLALASRAVLAVFAVRFLVDIGLRIVNPLLPLFVQFLSADQARLASVTGLINSATMITTTVGTLFAARYSERLGTRRVLWVSLVGTALCYIPQAAVHSTDQLLILKALSGLAMGGVLSTLSAELAAAAPEGRQGTVFGLQSTVHSIANAIGPLIGGALAASYGIRQPFAVGGLVLAAAAGLLILNRSRAA